MIHKSKVLYGIASYIDDEIVAKLAGGWKAWVVGGMAGIAVSRADGLLSQLANNPMVKALGLIDGENIDVETIYEELRRQAQKGAATVELPMLGVITFSVSDVDSLYRYIKGA
jgi:hypothetical protein